MRYSEHAFDKKIENPLDLIKFIFFSMTMAPIRLFMEISKKIIFLGEYFTTYLITALVINAALIGVTTIYSVFISKKVYLFYGSVPIASLIISFCLLLGLFIYCSRLRLDVDLDLLNNESTPKIQREDEKVTASKEVPLYEEPEELDVMSGFDDIIKPKKTTNSGGFNLDMLEDLSQEMANRKVYQSESEVESTMARKLQNISRQDANAEEYKKMQDAITNAEQLFCFSDEDALDMSAEPTEEEFVELDAKVTKKIREELEQGADELMAFLAEHEGESEDDRFDPMSILKL